MICRLPDSHRHQLSAIAPVSGNAKSKADCCPYVMSSRAPPLAVVNSGAVSTGSSVPVWRGDADSFLAEAPAPAKHGECLRPDHLAACPFTADSSEPDRPQAVKAGAVAPPIRGFGLDGLMPPRFGLFMQTKADCGRTALLTNDEEVAAWFYCGPLDYLFAGPESLAVGVTGCQSPLSILFSAVSALQPSGDHL